MPKVETPTIQHSVKQLEALMDLLQDVPEDWVGGKRQRKRTAKGEMPLIPCENYKTLMNAWRKALKWTDGLDCALSVMLASVMSVKTLGDQLWIKIIGPASCGKSTLCEAVSANTRFVIAKSSIRGFHSGYGDENEDNSLVARLHDKTLITKDGDTLLQSPNLGQILAEARDLYDCTARTHYRNRKSMDYSGVRMTWILSGTSSLRSIDSSELGERFLDCVIMDGIDEELEDEILWRVANRADRDVAVESNGKVESQHNPDMAVAMQMTGGYVDHLRENATSILNSVANPEAMRRRCVRLGKFVAFMRARPSTLQDENAEREFAARLVIQMVRVSKCLAGVLNKSEVDDEVIRRVTKVATDTARGQTLDICRVLYERKSVQARQLGMATDIEDAKLKKLLGFLHKIGVAESTRRKNRVYWSLRQSARDLLKEVLY